MNSVKQEAAVVQPAFSPKGWSQLLAAGVVMPAGKSIEGSLGMAAIALHEHPQGFTWNDVDLLLDLAAADDKDATVEALYEGGGALAAESLQVRAANLRNLAARIEALLAPRV